MAITEYKYLSEEQRAHFLKHGWVRIPDAVPKEHIEKFTEHVWVRLGYDPEDKSTWDKEKARVLLLAAMYDDAYYRVRRYVSSREA